MRVMCVDCPFNPSSRTFKYRDDWIKELELAQFEQQIETPQGCHTLADGQVDSTPFQEDENLQCVGHVQYMKNKRKL